MAVASVHVADIGPGRAFRMLRGPRRVPGLVSADAAVAAPLRTGGAPRPMAGRVALVAFWEEDSALDGFLAEHPYARRLAAGWRARLEPLRACGAWPGVPGDVPRSRAVTHDGPTAVVTLGRLRLPQTRRFVRASRSAEAAAVAAPGFLWGTAMARPPFVATLSLWHSADAAASYAYGADPEAHAQAIAADRQKPFHHRSAFVRFRLLEVDGSLQGRNALPEALVQATPR